VKILPGQSFRFPFAEATSLGEIVSAKKPRGFRLRAYAERSNREARSRSVAGTGALGWVGTTALRLARG
jgi:hypothetical protein